MLKESDKNVLSCNVCCSRNTIYRTAIDKQMDNDSRRELPSYAFNVWMGQWQISTLETEGCMFVLRFLLRAFRSRRPEDKFWTFLERFLFAEEQQQGIAESEFRSCTSSDLLAYAGTLPPEHARALVAYLSECYAAENDRLFWNTVSEAIQLYTVAPYDGHAGSA